ncbi:hypothetical protein BDD21_5243 [Thiocapsa rosea]|uniref:Uncharacterized protein n=1 Tax=Thiocapsa rosea TaxID=69360 RepID=A0A495VE75_9GAMM|nr:hypothetical protein BDD21_5243 [Thiocapsa rosea]
MRARGHEHHCLGRDVLDHKPRHLIVRPCMRSAGLAIRRRWTLWATLVDDEVFVSDPAPGVRPGTGPGTPP